MKILALDSSGLVASVAVMQDDTLLAEYTVNYKKTHSQTLLPMLDEVAKMTELDLNTIDAIAVSGGPGSFTGLRIGSATAKGLGLALKKPLIHIPTVDALAYNLYGTEKVICPIMDARRNQVYTGIYQFRAKTDSKEESTLKNTECTAKNDEFCVLMEQTPMAVEELIQKLNEENQPVIFLGDGVPVYRELIEKLIKVPHQYAPAHSNRQRAASVAALGMQYAAEGKMETAAEHMPDYLRLSQAERELAKKQIPGDAGYQADAENKR